MGLSSDPSVYPPGYAFMVISLVQPSELDSETYTWSVVG